MGRPRKFEDDSVVEQVMQVFWSEGYAAASVSDLVSATGLGKGSLYGSFGGKQALFTLALQRYSEQVLEEARAALDGDDAGAASRLRGYVLGALPPQDEVTHRACLLSHSAAELGAREPEVRSTVRKAYDQLRDLFEDVLVQAQNAGTVSGEVHPRQAANGLVTVLRGVEALREVGAESQVLRDAVNMALRSAGLGPEEQD